MSCNVKDSPDAKKPCKGILKSSSSFDKQCMITGHRKSAKFDEVNVLQTYHPPDKDYGHMKIEEPKTPYNYSDPAISDMDQLDAAMLAEKLQMAANSRTSSVSSEDLSEGDEDETDEEKSRRFEFEKRRKMHYNEYQAVKLARRLIEEEDDDDEDGAAAPKESNLAKRKPTSYDENSMDVEEGASKTEPTTSRATAHKQ